MNIYGIKNCNTVKKAINWLKENNIDFEFHDFKKEGVSLEKLKEWSSKAGYEKVLNKQGLTWKQLSPEVKENVKGETEALSLLQEKTSMIKRPVIEDGSFLFFGFNEESYRQHFL